MKALTGWLALGTVVLAVAADHCPTFMDEICPPNNNTCCVETRIGAATCCPLPNAVCCNESNTCCPSGYKCGKNDTCLKAPQVVYCPDGLHTCQDGFTCCRGRYPGQFTCCAGIQATCCPDGIHCCPHNTICDLTYNRCIRADGNFTHLQPSKEEEAKEKMAQVVYCPDGYHTCQNGFTCCRGRYSGQFMCCAGIQATCCPDGIHCCPHNTICDLAYNRCIRADGNFTSLQPSKEVEAKEKMAQVTMPTISNDNKISEEAGTAQSFAIQEERGAENFTSCKAGDTLCKDKEGRAGCCPYKHGVCCSASRCCPNYYRCNKEVGGDYTCTFYKATKKCSDKIHFCPLGFDCDSLLESCQIGEIGIPWFETEASRECYQPKQNKVYCPDHASTCLDGMTCCQMKDTSWGCCPITNGICCSDGTHCCPPGYACDISGYRCLKNDASIKIPMDATIFRKDAIVRQKASKVAPKSLCPDKNYCAPGKTCIQLENGSYGCCPEDTLGDLSLQMCIKVLSFQPLLTDLSVGLKSSGPLSAGEICPDNTRCPQSSTCCQISDNSYGCCPYPDAVCCSDEIHCCPQDYSCDVPNQRCIRRESMDPVIRPNPRVDFNGNANKSIDEVLCPDLSYCPDGTTCCEMSDDDYGCCPYSEAVCCSDMLHCCPQSYVCDVSNNECLRVASSLWPISRDIKIPRGPHESITVCPNGEDCPDQETCCPMENGRYGCCPSLNAVCCNDQEHCCPEGYLCAEAIGMCIKMEHAMLHSVLEGSAHEGSITCPDDHECADNQTCCPLQNASYACCPMPQAICCDDKKHCCPKGYTCFPELSICLKSDVVLPATRRSFSGYQMYVLPEGRSGCQNPSYCSTEETCCPSNTGVLPCCPLKNSTCCDDEEHCCPGGYDCVPEMKLCLQKDVSIPLLKNVLPDNKSTKNPL